MKLFPKYYPRALSSIKTWCLYLIICFAMFLLFKKYAYAKKNKCFLNWGAMVYNCKLFPNSDADNNI